MKTKYKVIAILVVLALLLIYLLVNTNMNDGGYEVGLVSSEKDTSLTYNPLYTDKRVDETKAKIADHESKLGTEGNNDYNSHIDIALLYSNLGDGAKVLEHLNVAIKIEPNNPLAYDNAGTMLERVGAYKSAEAAFNKALEVDPDFAYTHMLVIDLHKSYLNSSFEVREQVYKDALTQTNNDLQIMKEYAVFLSDSGKLQESVQLWQQIIDLEPDQTAKELIFQEITRLSDKIIKETGIKITY